jgi:cell division protease FtsH
LEKAKDKVMMGAERRSMIITDKEKEITAYHEAGHALVAIMLPNTDPIHKVTIIPRGRALGLTQQLPIEEKHTHSKNYLINRICILLGDRTAESIVFEDSTTGAGNDIEQAATLARKMVCEWGMSAKMGPLTFGKREESIFLGKEFARHQDYSEATAVRIDDEIRQFVNAAYVDARKIIEQHRDALEGIAAALLEVEVLDGEKILEIVADRSDLDADHLRKNKERLSSPVPPITEVPEPA